MPFKTSLLVVISIPCFRVRCLVMKDVEPVAYFKFIWHILQTVTASHKVHRCYIENQNSPKLSILTPFCQVNTESITRTEFRNNGTESDPINLTLGSQLFRVPVAALPMVIGTSRGLCFPRSLICISYGTYEIDDCFFCIPFYVKLIRYQFWCTRCAFRLLKYLQWCSGRKGWKSDKKCENWKTRRMKTKQSAMKLSQICRRIELCLREIIFVLRWIYKIYFFLDSSIHIRILKQAPKYLATGL
jgi:hypothetical protein